jgi:hypothetical protein
MRRRELAVRRNDLFLVASVLVLALSALSDALGQAASDAELEKAIVEQIKEAYKAVYEAPKIFRDELNGYYKRPTPEREAALLKQVRRRYVLTLAQEKAIVQALRRACEHRSPEQEEFIFGEIRKARRLTEGAVPASVQSSQISKFFARLDRNGDGFLGESELNKTQSAALAPWDANEDGFISMDEYEAYYQNWLQWISDRVAAGKIELGLKGNPLPTWFDDLDTDADGQVSLYEWHKAGKPLPEFASWDRNGDGLATSEEVFWRMAQINRDFGLAAGNGGPASTLGQTKDKKK